MEQKNLKAEEQKQEVWSEAEIANALSANPMIHQVAFCPEIDSTNLWAKRESSKGAEDGTLFLADAQSAGRGRFGRVWKSESGEAIYLSLLLRPEIQPVNASMLTLVMGLAVAQGVQKVTGLACGIKWPNDIVVAGKKICGILTEMAMASDKIAHIIIGVGINVNNAEFSEELQDKATSLFLQKGDKVSRLSVLSEVLACFEENYRAFLKSEDLSGLREAYEQLLINRNREVRIIERDREYTGIAEGINSKGELLIKKEDGSVEAVCAGEVSVRGLYSYV